ncbi:MAG: ATP-binding cassette domain-containing protein, partial [Alphaproteobacteria bacterium]|nr:ATP-binding cassette domain-containing protein [Alphaproteobacteria bacterium]
GHGRIETPDQDKILFLPQKPYLPIGSLRAVTAYPAPAEGFSDAAIIAALTAVGLGHLTSQLDDSHYWAQTLSLGEQQRLSFARVLLHKPHWLFLDEATSALDEASEDELYRLLKARLPAATIISIGHRSTLVSHHQRTLRLGTDFGRQPAPSAG